MHRLQIRDFGSYKTMVTAHTVDVGGGRAGLVVDVQHHGLAAVRQQLLDHGEAQSASLWPAGEEGIENPRQLVRVYPGP